MSKRPLFFGVAALAVAFPVIAVASPLAIPNAFMEDDIITAAAFNENFDAVADAVNDNDARITLLEEGLAAAGVPAGTIAFFPVIDDTTVDGCPPGWTEYADLRGRVPIGLAENGTIVETEGTALAAGAQRTINQVVSHTHPDNFAITADQGTHSHTVGADGAHDHSINLESGNTFGTFGAVGQTDNNGGSDSATPIDTEPDHTHPLIGAGTHDHTLTGSVSSAGSATVDVTMPYIQLLACAKE
jgi:hypothetical protein